LTEKQAALLREWQHKYERAYAAYKKPIKDMIDNEQAYLGTRTIKKPDGTEAANGQGTVPNVRKVVYELIEAQVDNTIPMPKVTPTRGVDNDTATVVEEMLKNQIDRLPLERLNDEQERICPTDGSSFFLVEWDNDKGDVAVKNLHPRSVIPQPGVPYIADMDYIFVLTEHTRDSILRQFKVDVGEIPTTNEAAITGETEAQAETDVHTMRTVYYRNADGGISLMSWVDDHVVQHIQDYQRRKKDICSGCGVDWDDDFEKCQICGSEEYEMVNRDYEEIIMDIVVGDGDNKRIIPAGSQIPYYVPDCFPIVMRKNISQYGQFCGGSDVQAVKDNQNDINIFMNKLRKKLLKGGSYVLKDPEMKVDASDDELKITNASTAQAQTFKVVNVQADVQYDISIVHSNYEYMRQTLGITDSFQGRPDPTAPSGTAKQLQVAQSSGRLESKRKMKDAAYAELYEIIFKFELAYSDSKREYRTMNSDGEIVFKEFNKFDFVEQVGEEWIWNDSFLFSVDDASSLSRNRELMWQEVRLNYQNGMYGAPGSTQSLLNVWKYLKLSHYPYASNMYDAYKILYEQEQEQQRIMMEFQKKQLMNANLSGGQPNAAPSMPQM